MSEALLLPHKGKVRRVVTGIAMSGLAAGLFGGCASVQTSEHMGKTVGSSHRFTLKDLPKAALRACFNEPMPLPKRPAIPKPPSDFNSTNYNAQYARFNALWKKWSQVEDPSKIILRPGSGDTVKGDPIALPKAAQTKVDNATVKVIDKSGYGTGFIVKGANGTDVVITAAHVIAGAASPIEVISNHNKRAYVTNGCYVYQKGNHLKRPADHPATVDMAVLELSSSVGAQPLDLATTEPARGSWVAFTNDQASIIYGQQLNGKASSPMHYEGMVLEEPNSFLGFSVLSGIEPFLGHQNWSSYSATPGASGGPVTENSTVIGMSVTSQESNLDLDEGVDADISLQEMQQIYNLSAVGSLQKNPGINYSVDGLVPSTEIEYMVEHGNY